MPAPKTPTAGDADGDQQDGEADQRGPVPTDAGSWRGIGEVLGYGLRPEADIGASAVAGSGSSMDGELSAT